ncbi:MAG: hypothetical protein ACP5VR_09340 [Acidimicrobiales bacterium]
MLKVYMYMYMYMYATPWYGALPREQSFHATAVTTTRLARADRSVHVRRRRLYRWAGVALWGSHVVLARAGFYRCPRCGGRLNYRWWCKRCQRYRIPAR